MDSYRVWSGRVGSRFSWAGSGRILKLGPACNSVVNRTIYRHLETSGVEWKMPHWPKAQCCIPSADLPAWISSDSDAGKSADVSMAASATNQIVDAEASHAHAFNPVYYYTDKTKWMNINASLMSQTSTRHNKSSNATTSIRSMSMKFSNDCASVVKSGWNTEFYILCSTHIAHPDPRFDAILSASPTLTADYNNYDILQTNRRYVKIRHVLQMINTSSERHLFYFLFSSVYRPTFHFYRNVSEISSTGKSGGLPLSG